MKTPRTMFPTLDDIPRDQWPLGIRVAEPDPTIGGSEVEVRCVGCMRFVPPRECLDLRECANPQALGITSLVCCRGCFHGQAHRGEHLHSQIARALGMHSAVVASLESGEREALARGWHTKSDRNKHLAP